MSSTRLSDRQIVLAVLVAALGYFVDIYDLILFGVVRRTSLLELGVAEAALQVEGERLVNFQMTGLLVGGVLWGILGDKRGRLSVLFGSIVTYSLANILNGLVHDLDTYAALRFVAGVGLAGELGAGITLVAEILRREGRGWGTTIVATVGICGGVVAALVGAEVHWRTAYFIGGGLGLALLGLRLGVRESAMFATVKAGAVRRGDVTALFRGAGRVRRYLAVILVGVPIWYVVGILIFFSPELGRALGLTGAEVPSAGKALMWCYVGLALGDLGSGVVSQLLRSRKRALALFLVLTAIAVGLYFGAGGRSRQGFYAICVLLGVATGYWAVFVTSAAEQFGTNLRATVTTTVPNFVRGAVVPMTLLYKQLRGSLGLVEGALAVGVLALALAAVALWLLDETYGKDLDFVEE